uniref:NADH dehydrogenase subunit 6 n=1 Tax=Physaloptera rara TaxID=2358290 RepID=A0A4Y6I400_9BILA|nr:NADH dehydrogenase subunit 6 [Physaloptera rara]
MLVFYVSLCVMFSFVFISLCFLCMEVLKSCFYFCLSVIFLAPLLCLGVVELGVYFVLLIFFSGILALMIYFCSLTLSESKSNMFLFFLLISSVCSMYSEYYLFYNWMLMDEVKFVYDDMNFFILLWLIGVLFSLLGFLSFNFVVKSCLRNM